MFADLHIHSTYSDSTLTPEEIIEEAKSNNISCVGIADHDTLDGIKPTIEAGKKYGIEVVPGIELSSEINAKDIHVLGYFIDYENPEFIEQLTCMQNTRVERMKKMIQKLSDLGINGIEFSEVSALAQSDSLGRPHLATIMTKKGKVSSNQEAFNKYISDDGPAYVPKFKQTPVDAINLINKFGGVAVLAHPAVTCIDELILGFVRDGLTGLEVFYPNISNSVVESYKNLAIKYDLALTGGSDAHGKAKDNTFIGKVKIPYDLVEELKQRVSCKK